MQSKDGSNYLPILKLFVVNMIYNIVYIIKVFLVGWMRDLKFIITVYTCFLLKKTFKSKFYNVLICDKIHVRLLKQRKSIYILTQKNK